ncbi:hypothetical protein LCGC14_2248880 [marine sediment metagenome]|uniref:ADF-H domain-containing protein n=1 Tax=marine sediment metagenome TaxID=412755 RepID=A0A0F9FFR2_9ZZZZ
MNLKNPKKTKFVYLRLTPQMNNDLSVLAATYSTTRAHIMRTFITEGVKKELKVKE